MKNKKKYFQKNKEQLLLSLVQLETVSTKAGIPVFS